jgi:hypothetical protein
MIMIKCSTEAYEKCEAHCHHCKTPDEAYYLEGSDCDKFNQQINHPPMTNADRIQSMGNDDMARILYACPWCHHHCEHSGEAECLDCIVRYLQQPAEEDNHGKT